MSSGVGEAAVATIDRSVGRLETDAGLRVAVRHRPPPAPAGGTVPIDLELGSDGPRPVIVTIVPPRPAGDAAARPCRMILLPGEVRAASVTLSVPDDAGPGPLVAELLVYPTAGDAVEVSILLQVVPAVREPEPPVEPRQRRVAAGRALVAVGVVLVAIAVFAGGPSPSGPAAPAPAGDGAVVVVVGAVSLAGGVDPGLVEVTLDGQPPGGVAVGADGRFTVPVQPGTYGVLVTAPGFEDHHQQVVAERDTVELAPIVLRPS